MKLNNKGFAITTILYGTLILFMLLFVSLLGIMSQYKKNLERLIEANNGARDIVTMKPQDISSSNNTTTEHRGFYYIDDKCYKYLKKNETINCN